jgi:hypothetical protein
MIERLHGSALIGMIPICFGFGRFDQHLIMYITCLVGDSC